MNNFLKRTWAQVNLDAIKNNYMEIRNIVRPETKIMCVVKADAYGHGAAILSKEYEKLGADWLAVSNIEEAVQIRRYGVKLPILILGYTPVNMVKELSYYDISQAVFSLDYARELSDQALNNNVLVKIHIKLDTGMGRIGFSIQDIERDKNVVNTIEKIFDFKGIKVEGMFTHFAVSDEPGNGVENTKTQYNNFIFVANELKKRGKEIPLKHCGNSAAILNYPEMNLDMVRAGIILYGLFPSDFVNHELRLQPSLEFKTVVSMIKEVPKGTSISYGRTYITNKTTKVATVPVGYADGYLRAFSNKASMLINGKRVPVIGRVCMDQLMLDVTNIPDIKTGDEVTIFGQDGESNISINELANLAGTINYEIMCMISKRVPRVYIKENRVVDRVDYICPKFQIF